MTLVGFLGAVTAIVVEAILDRFIDTAAFALAILGFGVVSILLLAYLMAGTSWGTEFTSGLMFTFIGWQAKTLGPIFSRWLTRRRSMKG